jgi:1-acyl-sn-glycerol-3-phosphate acyltransferase
MKEALSFLRALLIIDPLIYLYTFVMGAASLCGSLFDSTGRFQHRCARVWSRLILATSGIRVAPSGYENFDPARTYIYAANHRSLMDTPVMFAYLPVQFRILAKKSLFALPFLGWHLRRSGHLPVERDSPRAALRSLEMAAQRVREGAPVVFFPEGTRSRDGRMREFKHGAALLAIKAGVPLIPVAISGTREALKPDTLHVRPGRVRIRFGAPLPTAGLSHRDAAGLSELAREKIEFMLDELAAEVGNEASVDRSHLPAGPASGPASAR